MDTDEKTGQTDEANLAKTGQTGNAPGTAAPQAQAQVDPKPAPDAPKEGNSAGQRPLVEGGEIRGQARDYHTQDSSHVVSGDAAHREAQIERTERLLEKRSEDNEEGHDKVQRKIREDAERAHENTAKAPPTGREFNRNTPLVDKDGNKHWVD